MTLNRRELLSTFGVASASALLWSFGCATAPAIRRAPQVSSEIRSLLHDAVARLAAVYPSVHALAISRHRTAAAVDVLGAGVARTRGDGVVFTVRTPDGGWREQVTSELTSSGIEQALTALAATKTKQRGIDFGRPPPTPAEPPPHGDRELQRAVLGIMERDTALSSRIVYAAALIEIDDTVVWSVAPGRDLEQRLIRIRKRATRAAWNGTRPIVAEAEHAWRGSLGDQDLSAAEVTGATESALMLMTPGSFDDGERIIVLDPSVVAIVIDAAVRTLLTSSATRRPEVVKRLAAGASVASRLVTLTDDPTAAGAYGGFAFDDEGTPAEAIKLLDAGHIVGQLTDRAAGRGGRGRRAGHLGRIEPGPSHLRLEPGTGELRGLFTDGLLLEGGIGATVDPGSDRILVSVARARELKGDHDTGRVYADVELVGSLAQLLAAIDAVSNEPAAIAFRGESEREPRWRSVAAPAVRTRGLVRARRRRG